MRFRLTLLFVALTLAGFVCYSFRSTLQQLDVVEAERDHWQRPAGVLQALELKPGDHVVDLGSGAGYFALKIAEQVGGRGEVDAVDLRRLSLLFLFTRARLRGLHNVNVVTATLDDPHLHTGWADAVLIANTYHEFERPEWMLGKVHAALRPGGRLVIVDRAQGRAESVAQGHEVEAAVAEGQLLGAGFDVVRRESRFIERAGDDPWWLMVARRP